MFMGIDVIAVVYRLPVGHFISTSLRVSALWLLSTGPFIPISLQIPVGHRYFLYMSAYKIMSTPTKTPTLIGIREGILLGGDFTYIGRYIMLDIDRLSIGYR